MNLMSFSYPHQKRSKPLILQAQTKNSHTRSQIQYTQPIPLTQKIQQFGAPQNYQTIYLYAQNLSINYCQETKHLYCFYDKKDAFMTCKTSQSCLKSPTENFSKYETSSSLGPNLILFITRVFYTGSKPTIFYYYLYFQRQHQTISCCIRNLTLNKKSIHNKIIF